MKTDNPTPIARKDYQPPDYQIRTVDLDIVLDPLKTIVTSRLSVVAKNAARPPLRLDGQLLELRSVKLGERALVQGTDYTVDDSHLTILSMPEEAELEIVTCIAPEKNTALEGLYLSRGIYCTQCEAEGFRKITYFLDRPDILSVYKVRLTAPESCPVVLSNGNCVASGRTPEGCYFAEWHDPFPKPCYLFAAVAGQLEALRDDFTTASGRHVKLAIWTEIGNAVRCTYAMDSLKRSMKWDEEVFGLEYDLDEFNIVAVQDFNMGAMENKSLNVFNAQYILADPATATDRDYAGIESVVGHEYFHNWTGNRVTCRDWFELCLKEGLTVFREQEFAADQRSRPLRRIEDVRTLRGRQFPEDAGPLAHPVRPESFIEISNFYTATIYEKGAEVIRMLSVLIGRDAFLKGHRIYIDRNDGTAARVDDFLAAMSEASGRDLTQFARWYSEIGTPEVTATSAYGNGVLEVNLSQKGPVRVIPLAIGLIDGQGRDIKSEVLILDAESKTFRFSDLKEKPHLSLNRDFSAPIRLKHDLDTKDLIFLFGHDQNAFARFEAGQDLALNFLMAAVADPSLRPSKDLLDAFASVLEDDKLDPAFIAEALALPAERMIGDRMDKVDAAGIHRAREMLNRAIADHCRPRLTDLYWSLSAKPFSPDAESAGRRALSNLSLALLAADGNADAIELTMRQYISADNMTDRMAALTILSRHDIPERRIALEEFEVRYAAHPLVMNKWLAVQAMAPLRDTLAEVEKLMTHSVFNLKNPNNVRALIGSFASGNQFRFHDPDGSGYRFLSKMVSTLDPLNPQIAARLVEPLCQWRRYPERAAAAMRDGLSPILSQPGLSRDTYEVVSKALAQ